MRRSDLREKYGTLNEEQLQPKLLHDEWRTKWQTKHLEKQSGILLFAPVVNVYESRIMLAYSSMTYIRGRSY